MFFIKIVVLISLLFLQISSQLSCSIYDYTKETLSCVSSCPSGSVLVDKNKCLRRDQYIVQGNVMLCPSFVTSDDRTICCQKDQYIVDNQCQVCNGNVYQNGIYCCSGSQYMNYVSKTVGCTKISTGECLSISLQSRFKVCCPSGQFYHLEMNSCVPSSGYNCDSGLGVCCNSGKYLQYISSLKQYACVQNCNWTKTDGFKCSQQYCTSNQVVLQSGQSIRELYSLQQTNNSTTSLLVFNNQCCYGLSTTGQCIKNYNANQCGKRFINRAWSVCCAFGLYYNVQQKTCLDTCTGYVILDMICVTNNSYLILTNSSPTQTTSATCNGLTLPSSFPVCCPKGFYLDGLNGCKLCIGTIHKMTYFQVCCSPHQYFDKNLQKCRTCQGKVDKTGLLCCFQNQYFSYSQSGIGSCNSYCDNSNIYQTSYCCQSLSNPSCQLSTFKPTVCSSQYFVDNFCQVCPRYCSNIEACTTGDVLKCQKVCQQNTVYFSDLDQCLSCDNSCSGCTAPFDNSACTNCAQGYVMVNRICVRCGINCKTCVGSPNNCSSCDETSPRPFLQNGQCVRFCGSGNYDDGNQCQMCNFNCVQCQGSNQSQCSKCQKSSFLTSTFSGECQGCSGVCDQCFRSSSSCIRCKNTYKYYPNTKTCTVSCQSNEISVRFSNSSMQTCYPCHSMCKTCQLSPQNCYTCKNNSQYLDSSFGVNLCMDCVQPCVFCSSKENCTSCIDGYYLNMDTQKCIACVTTCKTCHNGYDIGCLSCHGDSQLVGGKCIGCSSSCAKCDINQNCIQCNNNFFLFSGACLTKCPDGYYGVNKKCSLCYSQCLTCSNGTQNGCLTCSDKLLLINGKCVGCSDNCKSCNVNLSCTQCNDGYFLYQQICQTSCPKGTYTFNGSCKSCPSACSACISGLSCTQCFTGYPILFRGQCLIQCPDGYEKITDSNSCQIKNNTNNNNTNNNTNNNGTNNNGTNNNNTNNNNTNNNTNTTTSIKTKITLQTFYYDSTTMIGYINLYFNSTNKDQITTIVSNYKLYLINLGTKIQKQIPVSITAYDFNNKKVLIKSASFDGINIKDYDALATIVSSTSTSTSVSTHVSSQMISSKDLKKISAVSTAPSYQRVSSQFFNQLMVGSYKSSPLSNIKIIGIFISLTLLIFSTLSKLKSHFLAQQANALLLHYINFAQVVYLFKYIKLDENGYFGFLQGFGYAMLSFFPNFFSGLIPLDYVQTTNQKSLVPDANLIRNAGFVFSYQLIILGCLLVGTLVSYGWWKKHRLQELPHIRKVMRIGVLWFGVGFLPQLFFSFAQLFVPSTFQNQYEGFHTGNVTFSYLIVFLVPILMCGIFYDFYSTYNSDVLEHYYTLRQGAQYVQIYAQSLILALSIERPLIALILIPLQLLWLGFNYMLYRYGEGYHLLDCTKFIVSSSLIILGILNLSLIENVRWEIIMAIIIITFIVNIIYATYQVVGLYYYYLFKDKPIKDN